MFNRWKMHHGHPAFAWGQPGPGPDENEQSWEHQGPWGRRGPWAHQGHGPEGHWGPWGRRGPQPDENEQPWGRRGPAMPRPEWGGHHGGPEFGPPGHGWWMRRGFGGGRGPGPGGPGPGPGGPRAFGRGDLKYQLLALLQDRPKHGYEMIKEMEEQTHGFYTPSAGAVYPSLQLMEDRGWITSQTADGKKVYTVTDAGRQALDEHRRTEDTFGGPWGWGQRGHGHEGHPGGPFGHQARPELMALRQESGEVARLLWGAVRAVMTAGGDPEKLARLRGILTQARIQLQEFVGQGEPGADSEPGERARGPVERS